MHCTLRDWAEFVAIHLQGARGKSNLLKPGTYKVLHTAPTGQTGQQFAMGWAIEHRPWTRGPILTHGGTNNTWQAAVVLAPDLDVAFLAVSNQGDAVGWQAVEEAIAALVVLHKNSAGRGR